ncbi:transposase [Micromonospora deserti]|uniref:transposase n=1 Tax=Micromonospora deserti TaxID=2070366 RepID=UPI001F446971|nr:transposase [Micromonospora deserti]
MTADASIDVDGKTNEITCFASLLDQIDDLTGVVVTADALHCQREHIAYLAQCGTNWILTVKGLRPTCTPNSLPCPGEPFRTPIAPTGATAAGKSAASRSCPSPPASTSPRRAGVADPTPSSATRPAETLHHRDRVRHHRPARAPGQTTGQVGLDQHQVRRWDSWHRSPPWPWPPSPSWRSTPPTLPTNPRRAD